MSALFGEVTMKSNLLSDLKISSGLLCVESDVRVITSTVGDLMISFSSMRTKDLFCCFSIWSFVCCKAAALDFERNESFGFWFCSRFPSCSALVSFCALECYFLLCIDSCCLGCCLTVLTLCFVDELRPCIHDCCFCFDSLFSSKLNCGFFLIIVVFS